MNAYDMFDDESVSRSRTARFDGWTDADYKRWIKESVSQAWEAYENQLLADCAELGPKIG